MDLEIAISMVNKETRVATVGNKPFNSCHEGYAVILEELDELWQEVKKKKHERDIIKLRIEAMQVAAMAIRFLMDLT
jgi:hypothetical protein